MGGGSGARDAGTGGQVGVGAQDAGIAPLDASTGGGASALDATVEAESGSDAGAGGDGTSDANSSATDSAVCKDPGTLCNASSQCCSHYCNTDVRLPSTCQFDGAPCAASSNTCCSKVCGSAGTCTPLPSACRTLGNPCQVNGECCSKLCLAGRCEASSYCSQPDDVCTTDQECCSGLCNKVAGEIGTCATRPPGAATCGSVSGVVCSTCADCCTGMCAPGPYGVPVCYPAGGCHMAGELCTRDADCCGGESGATGLPGAGTVQCQIEPGATVGICSAGQACTPQGASCHYKQPYYCSSPPTVGGSCCSETGAWGTCAVDPYGTLRCNGFDASVCAGLQPGDKCSLCMLDPVGIPRCNGLAVCVPEGGLCSNAGDCCGQAPCVADSNGTLRCLSPLPNEPSSCSPCGGACTVNADCCYGTCTIPVGSVNGTCECPPPSTEGICGSCVPYGGACSQASDCCSGIPCLGGQCRAPGG